MKRLVKTVAKFFNCPNATAMQFLTDHEYRDLVAEASRAYYDQIQMWRTDNPFAKEGT